nr:MAG TPA: hypothetical protein [Microviridae sp.]
MAFNSLVTFMPSDTAFFLAVLSIVITVKERNLNVI